MNNKKLITLTTKCLKHLGKEQEHLNSRQEVFESDIEMAQKKSQGERFRKLAAKERILYERTLEELNRESKRDELRRSVHPVLGRPTMMDYPNIFSQNQMTA